MERKNLKTPMDKYLHDPQYHQLVKMLVGFIEECKFTPSELREAAVHASIMHEMMKPPQFTTPEVEEAFKVLRGFEHGTQGNPVKFGSSGS